MPIRHRSLRQPTSRTLPSIVYTLLSVPLLTIWLALGTGPAWAHEESTVLYQCSGQQLKDSKWGKIAQFQKALSRKLQTGRNSHIEATGKFDSTTLQSLKMLMTCSDLEECAVEPTNPLYGTIHTALWESLLPAIPIPTVHERAFALSLSHEGTDFDQVQWNYGARDDRSALTWGPYGATVGHGHEVQGILKQLNREDHTLLQTVFKDEYPTLQKLMEDEGNGYLILLDVYNDSQRREGWTEKFRTLSSHGRVRQLYERYAQSDKWLRQPIMRLYSILPDGCASGTEIDYAFFLDNAMHISISKQGIQHCKTMLEYKQQEAGRDLTPAERRRIISQCLTPVAKKKDRLGRNVVYYIDGIGYDALSPMERNAWMQRTGRRASDCGLSDERRYIPDFL